MLVELEKYISHVYVVYMVARVSLALARTTSWLTVSSGTPLSSGKGQKALCYGCCEAWR